MKRHVTLLTLAGLGYAFLYLPIATLIVYSFNASDRVMVWDGWSLRWYSALLQDASLLRAAALTLQVATVNAFGATFLGLLGGYLLARWREDAARSAAAAARGRA